MPPPFQDWLRAVLLHGAGRSEAILLALAHRGRDAGDLAALAQAMAPSRERWQETWAQGRAFAVTTNAILGTALPVMVGLPEIVAFLQEIGGLVPAHEKGPV